MAAALEYGGPRAIDFRVAPRGERLSDGCRQGAPSTEMIDIAWAAGPRGVEEGVCTAHACRSRKRSPRCADAALCRLFGQRAFDFDSIHWSEARQRRDPSRMTGSRSGVRLPPSTRSTSCMKQLYKLIDVLSVTGAGPTRSIPSLMLIKVRAHPSQLAGAHLHGRACSRPGGRCRTAAADLLGRLGA